MSFFLKLKLGLAALLVTGFVAAGDFMWQKSNAEGAYDTRDYVYSLIERLDGAPGIAGTVFRKSSLVTTALPPAPQGFDAISWMDVPYAYAHSAAQEAAEDAEIKRALAGSTIADRITDRDIEIYETHMSDVSRVYTSENGYFELTVDVEDIQINSANYQAFDARVEAHFDKITEKRFYFDHQGVAWMEAISPVETASNGDMPHRLRRFEAKMGVVTLFLTTRADKAELNRFMASLDLAPLRAFEADRVARAAAKQQQASAGQAVVVQRGSGACGAGQFCGATD